MRRADGQADKDGTLRCYMRETSDANAAGPTVGVSLWPTPYSCTAPQARHETCVIALHHYYSLHGDCDTTTRLWVYGASGILYMVGNDAYHDVTPHFCALVGDTAARREDSPLLSRCRFPATMLSPRGTTDALDPCAWRSCGKGSQGPIFMGASPYLRWSNCSRQDVLL